MQSVGAAAHCCALAGHIPGPMGAASKRWRAVQCDTARLVPNRPSIAAHGEHLLPPRQGEHAE